MNILIEKSEEHLFKICYCEKQGSELRYAENLTPEEVLGVIAALIKTDRCLNWLRTDEEHHMRRDPMYRPLEQLNLFNNENTEENAG